MLTQQDIDIFQTLSEQEFDNFKSRFSYQKFKKGQTLFKENDKVNEIYYIKKGLLKLSYIDSDAKESILSFAFEKWWETDMDAFSNQIPTNLRLKALEDTEVYSLPYEDYIYLSNHQDLTKYFLQKSINGHISTQKRILSLLTQNPLHKYEKFIKSYPHLTQRISKATLALYLGVSREVLSRIYKNK